MEYELLSNLNEYQEQAVIDDNRACLVNAQVGSGKTTVLISKVFYFHRVKAVSFEDMVVLTFTNKAANEIKERIKNTDAQIGEKEMQYFGTFHSVALRMLKTILPIEDLGYTKDFAVIDPDEEVEMALKIIMANSLSIKYPNKLYKRLERAIQGQFIYSSMKYNDDIQNLIKLLQQEKQEQNKMSFYDLINNAFTLLKNAEYRPRWIIIDEFQDSDELQLGFIRTLVGEQTKLFAVGDPNQIIYSWRGSSQNVFSSFRNEYGARELSLPINYRSCGTILEVAKCFLRTSSDLSGLREQGSKITIRNHYNPFNEAQYLCDKISDIVSQGSRYMDIAIFYRLQRQSITLEDVFKKHGIPYEVSMRKTLKDIPVLGWLVKLMKFSVNNNDIDSAIYVLSDNTYGEHFFSGVSKKMINNDEARKLKIYRKMQGFAEWCRDNNSVIDAYEYFELDNYINPTSSSFIEDKKHILALLEKIDAYIKLHNFTLFDGVVDFVDSSALYGIDFLKDDVQLNSNTVKLMTLHASKGLEFKHVFIIGANFGSIPLPTTSAEEQDEEKRLFFVGITRAKDFLEISYYTSPDDPRVVPGASSYLSMIPAHLVDREEMNAGTVDLQSFRREVAQMKNQPSITSIVPPSHSGGRKVKHPKYGVGTVCKETEDVITVNFNGYGDKEFLKALSELEEL